MRILLFSTAYNGLSQRVHKELGLVGHRVSIELSNKPEIMQTTVDKFQPDLVICPFLKHRIPDEIWQQVPCLVLHPGIIGDKGPSSLDWAIMNKEKIWGATLLQANHDFDAGKVWATSYFSMPENSKASIYRHQIKQVATQMILDSVAHFSAGKVPNVKRSTAKLTGKLRPLMKQEDRKINWQEDSGATIVKKIDAADSFPGVLDQINGISFNLFSAKFESMDSSNFSPGEIIGQKEEAICRATIDGAVWIKQLKKSCVKDKKYFKLPAMRALTKDFPELSSLPELSSTVQQDIYVERDNEVAYLHFNFYNAAFNTQQCQALLSKFQSIAKEPEIKVIVLMGGEDFWSNGIHLNCIENSKKPAEESWKNINAINDFVEAIINCKTALTVAALCNNAGAGGAIVPLACDYVIARDGVVLNPHYQTMGLTGSEYWTYLLPKRVGSKTANELTTKCLPILAREALEINMVDTIFSENMPQYRLQLKEYCKALSSSEGYQALLDSKLILRRQEESITPLMEYRKKELVKMAEIFNDSESSYHRRRYNFVHKISCNRTPERLRTNVEQEVGSELETS